MNAETVQTVGFIGLGNIGTPIAQRLAERWPVVAYDNRSVSDERRDVLRLAESVDQVTRNCDLVCLCLPTPQASLNVVTAITQTLDRRADTIIELSTIGPDAATSCSRLATSAGLLYLDAPVSGGIGRARTGDLAIMTAGSPEALERSKDLLGHMSRRHFTLGEVPGAGQAMKLVNNMTEGIILAGTSEALAYGVSQGLDLKQMVDVLNVSTGRSDISEVKFVDYIIPGQYRGAVAPTMAKDLDLFAAEAGRHMPVAENARRVWREFADQRPHADFCEIYNYIVEATTTDESESEGKH